MSVMYPILKAKLETIKTIIAGHYILHKSLAMNLLKILNLRTIVLVRRSFYGFESACEMLLFPLLYQFFIILFRLRKNSGNINSFYSVFMILN